MSSCLNLRIEIDKQQKEIAALRDPLENIKEHIETLRHHEGDYNNVLHVEKSVLLIISEQLGYD